MFIIKLALALKWLPIFEVRQSVRKNLSLYEIKASWHQKGLNDLYSLIVMHHKTHPFASRTRLLFDTSQLANKNCSCARPWNNLYVFNSNIMKELTLSCPFSSVVLHFVLKKIKRNTISLKKLLNFWQNYNQSIKRQEYLFLWKKHWTLDMGALLGTPWMLLMARLVTQCYHLHWLIGLNKPGFTNIRTCVGYSISRYSVPCNRWSSSKQK